MMQGSALFVAVGVALGLAAAQFGSPIPEAVAEAAASTAPPATYLPPTQNTGGASPVRALVHREVYYPGTEDLAPGEMCVIALGTGMPNARPKQAAACWLVELGNGDKFLFDIGTGSAERISAMKIPFNYVDKVFIGHLHSDHFEARLYVRRRGGVGVRVGLELRARWWEALAWRGPGSLTKRALAECVYILQGGATGGMTG